MSEFTSLFEGIKKLADAFGPQAGIALAFGLVAFYYYRRDAKEREASTCADRAVLMDAMLKNAAVIERNNGISEKLADAVDRLADANRVSAEAYTRQIDRIVDLLRFNIPPPPVR